jgi:hypothetical protein
MGDYASVNNGWVELYLTAALGDGLSKEYDADHEQETVDTKALYFLNKLFQDDESNLVTSWRRAQVRLFWSGLTFPYYGPLRCLAAACSAWHPCA